LDRPRGEGRLLVVIAVPVPRGQRYVHAAKSALLPKLDPELITRCMGAASQTAAVKELRSAPKASIKRRKRT
jgi:hypothetical protein